MNQENRIAMKTSNHTDEIEKKDNWNTQEQLNVKMFILPKKIENDRNIISILVASPGIFSHLIDSCAHFSTQAMCKMCEVSIYSLHSFPLFHPTILSSHFSPSLSCACIQYFHFIILVGFSGTHTHTRARNRSHCFCLGHYFIPFHQLKLKFK